MPVCQVHSQVQLRLLSKEFLRVTAKQWGDPCLLAFNFLVFTLGPVNDSVIYKKLREAEAVLQFPRR